MLSEQEHSEERWNIIAIKIILYYININQDLGERPPWTWKRTLDSVPQAFNWLSVNIFISRRDELNRMIDHFVIVTKAL